MAGKLIQIRPPILGLNTFDQHVDFNSGFARELTNLCIVNGKLRMRAANKLIVPARQSIVNIAHLREDIGTSNVQYAIEREAPGKIVDYSFDILAGNIGGASLYASTTFKHATVEVLCGCREPRSGIYPFASLAFVLNSITDETTIVAGCSHRGRPYFTNGTVIEYGDLEQITGTFGSDGLSGGTLTPTAYMDGQSILRLFSLTAQNGNNNTSLFIIFGNKGKVVVYAGDWPDSANWEYLSSFNMPKPISRVGFIDKDGDIMVATVDYPYSMVELLQEGAANAYNSRRSLPIDALWGALEWSTAETSDNIPFAIYVGQPDSIVTLDCYIFKASGVGTSGLNLIGNYGNASPYLVYFRQYKAWALWLMQPLCWPVRSSDFSDFVFGHVGNGAMCRLFTSSVRDDANGSAQDIYCSWKTPYTSPFESKNQKVSGVRVNYKNPVTGYFQKIRTIFDDSDLNAPFGFYSQPSVTEIVPGVKGEASLDLPAKASSVYNPIANPGGQGGMVSFNFVLAAKSTAGINSGALEIFGATALVEDGGVLF